MAVIELQDVQPEITAKVIRFIESKNKFTTKELFSAYENTPEHLLRIALNNCRVQEKIFMHGNKRGAFYSKEKEDDSSVTSSTDVKIVNQKLKDIILQKAKNIGKWFKRSDLELDNDYYPVEILSALKELKNENTIEIQGELRWTQYCATEYLNINDNNAKTIEVSDLQSNILNFIKKNKVTTIPEIVEEFELQRYKIIAVLDKLIESEEIRHEGIKKASKYIYKTVTPSEVEDILSDISKERCLSDDSIDDLSEFLLSSQAPCLSIGMRKEKGFISKISNGSIIEKNEFDSMDKIKEYIKEITEIQ